MTMRFMDPCDLDIGTDNADHYWDGTFRSGTNAETSYVAGGRWGTGFLRCGIADFGSPRTVVVAALFPDNPVELFTGFYLDMPDIDATLLVYRDDSAVVHVSVRKNVDGTLDVVGPFGTVTTPDAVVQYDYIEFRALIDDATGSYELRINNNTILSDSGVDTKGAGTNPGIGEILLGSLGDAATFSNLDYGDIYILDPSGTRNNTFKGDSRVLSFLPTGAGNYTQLTPSTGANWENVDDSPTVDDDSTFNEGSANLGKDSFVHSGSVADGPVGCVQAINQARKDQAGNVSIKSLVRHGGVDAIQATAETLDDSLTYRAYRGDMEEVNPDTGVDWLASEIATVEVGCEIGT